MIYWKLTWSWKMHEWLGPCCRRWRPRVRNNLHQKLMKLVQSPITDPASTLRSQLWRGILMPTMSLPAVLTSTNPTAKFPSNTSMVCNISTLTYDSSMQVTIFFSSPYPCNFALWWCFKFRQNSKPFFPSKVRRFCTCSNIICFWNLTLFKLWWGFVCSELGVLTWTQIETEEYETNEFLNNVKKARGYNYEEVLTVAPGKIPNFEANTKKFYTEHLHEHEEIRFILDGVGMCGNFYLHQISSWCFFSHFPQVHNTLESWELNL